MVLKSVLEDYYHVFDIESWLQFDPEKLRKLRPVFKENGTITAGNSSSISDGAAVLLLTSAAYAEQQDLPIMARICGFGDAAQVTSLEPYVWGLVFVESEYCLEVTYAVAHSVKCSFQWSR